MPLIYYRGTYCHITGGEKKSYSLPINTSNETSSYLSKRKER